jgi:hypothetical protein
VTQPHSFLYAAQYRFAKLRKLRDIALPHQLQEREEVARPVRERLARGRVDHGVARALENLRAQLTPLAVVECTASSPGIGSHCLSTASHIRQSPGTSRMKWSRH